MNAELPATLVRSLLLSIERLGSDARRVLEQLPKAGRTRSPWEELVVTLETFFSLEGIPATQRLMQDMATRSSSVLLATELLGDVRQTYQLLFEASLHQHFVSVSARPLGSGGLQVHLELNRGLRPSMVFFQSCVWFLAALPRARGLGDARVVADKLSERELRCHVWPPPDDRKLKLEHPDGHLRALSHKVYRRDEAPHSTRRTVPSTQMLQERFGLTRAEARIVRRLAEGESIKRIAEELRVSPETARTHAKRAMQKTDTHRQAELVSLVLQGDD